MSSIDKERKKISANMLLLLTDWTTGGGIASRQHQYESPWCLHLTVQMQTVFHRLSAQRTNPGAENGLCFPPCCPLPDLQAQLCSKEVRRIKRELRSKCPPTQGENYKHDPAFGAGSLTHEDHQKECTFKQPCITSKCCSIRKKTISTMHTT